MSLGLLVERTMNDKTKEKFLIMLRDLIKEHLSESSVLLESPVRSNAEVLTENKINKLLER